MLVPFNRVVGMRNRFALVWVMALLLAACGGEEPGLGEGRELDRCSLVTTDEAAQWLGEPVEAAPSEGVNGEPSPVTCLYKGTNATVLVQVRDGEVFFAEKGSPSRSGDDIEDLGEDAFTDGSKVEFLQNDWSVSISLISGLIDDGAVLDMARVISDDLP